MTDNTKPAVVLDHGTITTKLGLSDRESPMLLPSQTKSLKHPINSGVITDFTTMEELWHECFDAIGVNANEHRVLLAEPMGNIEKNRENSVEIMFETFNVPAMHLVPSPVLALFSSGRTSGTIFTSGSTFATTFAVPIYDGHIVPFMFGRLPIGGDTFDHSLKSELISRYAFMQYINDATIRQIKESACYVSQNFVQETLAGELVDYTLPDGQIIKLGDERFRCPEGFFNPSLLSVECEGVPSLINSVIMKNDEAIRKSLFKNIVLDGGSSMFTGIVERLQKEMEKLKPPQVDVKVIGMPSRTEAAWRGGCLLANLPTFDSWITSSEFSELGHKVLHTKCF